MVEVIGVMDGVGAVVDARCLASAENDEDHACVEKGGMSSEPSGRSPGVRLTVCPVRSE